MKQHQTPLFRSMFYEIIVKKRRNVTTFANTPISSFLKRNSYILHKSFWTFFIASVLTSLVILLNSLADGIIVSHLVAPDALSAIGVLSPVLNLLFVISNVICSGSGI